LSEDFVVKIWFASFVNKQCSFTSSYSTYLRLTEWA